MIEEIKIVNKQLKESNSKILFAQQDANDCRAYIEDAISDIKRGNTNAALEDLYLSLKYCLNGAKQLDAISSYFQPNEVFGIRMQQSIEDIRKKNALNFDEQIARWKKELNNLRHKTKI